VRWRNSGFPELLLDDLLEAANSFVQIRQMLFYTGHGAISLDAVNRKRN
jgi:hypothetical protein